jgi:membrane-associated protease RseP (regulator of RpoE activity)
MTPELREYFGIDGDRGVLVARVETDSPAQKAEVRVGDVIVEVDGTPIRRPRDLARVVRKAPEGATLQVDLIRKGELRSLGVSLPDREEWSWRGPMIPGLPSELFPPELDPEIIAPDFEQTLRLLRERLRELEERLDELEERIAPPAPSPDRT